MNYFYLLSLLLVFNACNAQQKRTGETNKDKPVFERITIPSFISNPAERAEYLTTHFWDTFDFRDTTGLSDPAYVEQALADFIGIAGEIPAGKARQAIQSLMRKAETDSTMFRFFSEQMERYLYDPNSPMRNEELYIPVLEYLTEHSALHDVEKIRPAHLLEMTLKNRPGAPAADFIYTLPNGRTGKLSDIKRDLIFLFFYNPDCHACQGVTEQLSASPVITRLEKEKRLQVVAIYPDEDLETWEKHLHEKPGHWINAYDKGTKIRDEEMYDLKAIPTLYLLDKQKTVLLKDATFEEIEFYIAQLLIQ